MRRIRTIALLACLAGCTTAEPTSPSLAIVKIVRAPFSLGFEGKSDIPIGTNVHGFVVTTFTPKFEKRTLPDGKDVTLDVSELTLKRGDKTIILVKGRRVTYQEYVVHLVNQSDQAEYSVRTGEEITIGSRRLRLREVRAKELNCTLEDVNSGERFTIKRMAQSEN